jgi:hypothetical protein
VEIAEDRREHEQLGKVMPHKPHHKDKRPKKLKDIGNKLAAKYKKPGVEELLEGGTGRSFWNPKVKRDGT